jgi:hypothetical protein
VRKAATKCAAAAITVNRSGLRMRHFDGPWRLLG